jgi:hypothetical protein
MYKSEQTVGPGLLVQNESGDDEDGAKRKVHLVG